MVVRNDIAKISRPQGQDGRRLRAGHRALLHAGLVAEEERPVGEGRDGRQPRAGRRRAGLRRRPERRGHDLRALSVDRARQARQAGKIIATTLDYPMVMDTFGCTPKFLADNPEGRQGAGRQLLRGGRDDQARSRSKTYEIMGADVKQIGRAVRQARPSTCAGRTGRRTRSSSPASCRPFCKEAGRPAARDRHHQGDARHRPASSTRSFIK